MSNFITEIEIKKVRHLENIKIPLSETERKHLILTGKNGSGKTSVLEKLNLFLQELITYEHNMKIFLKYKDKLDTLDEIKHKNILDVVFMFDKLVLKFNIKLE